MISFDARFSYSYALKNSLKTFYERPKKKDYYHRIFTRIITTFSATPQIGASIIGANYTSGRA